MHPAVRQRRVKQPFGSKNIRSLAIRKHDSVADGSGVTWCLREPGFQARESLWAPSHRIEVERYCLCEVGERAENGSIDGCSHHHGMHRPQGACRLLADGVDIRIIQLMLGHAGIQQTQRYLNVTDEELRRGLEVSWRNQGRPLRLASGS